ncbi:hypothetical protein MKZ38_003556 [Zalerion maritima]|uniref:Sulfotransferase n=1 Tax=Zalerion maritima TaxID=339359 RepID=A0AAD5RND7_9PEZI|nr:hypothetical protein MKZ38_003556 [Zalerion maritima]
MASSESRTVPMRIIVCGLQRTGTLSMRHALFALGFHNVHHMFTVFHEHPENTPLWTKALKAKYDPSPSNPPFTRGDWDELLGDCQATVDSPSALFGVELAKAYPEAKVVILNRDSEAWYNSVVGSIASIATPPLAARVSMFFFALFDGIGWENLKFLRTLMVLGHGGLSWSDKEASIKWFEGMYREFRENIPEERRLEFSVKDGYGPLCEFLGVPVPMETDEKTGEVRECKFPRKNDQAAFHKNVGGLARGIKVRAVKNMLAIVGGTAIVGGVAAWGVWKAGRWDDVARIVKG